MTPFRSKDFFTVKRPYSELPCLRTSLWYRLLGSDLVFVPFTPKLKEIEALKKKLGKAYRGAFLTQWDRLHVPTLIVIVREER